MLYRSHANTAPFYIRDLSTKVLLSVGGPETKALCTPLSNCILCSANVRYLTLVILCLLLSSEAHERGREKLQVLSEE